MIHQGTIALSASLHEIMESHRCLTVRLTESRQEPPAVAGVLRWEGSGQEWTAVCRGSSGELQDALVASGARIVSERAPSLDEIFVAHVGVAAAPGPET